jgi:hypothetical protein
MLKNKFILSLLSVVILGSGCKKYLDVNADPNNPPDVQESLLLVPIETATATTVVGGSWTTGNYPTVAMTDAYLVQQMALNQLPPQIDEYQMRAADYDQMFLTLYSTILQNLNILNKKATVNGNHAYGAIAKILTAYNLGIITDSWGDIPYTNALNGALTPAYDKQEAIYAKMDLLLDSAIAEAAMDPGKAVPGGDDFLYNGDMTLWQKFAYSLKARNYIHLTKAPGHNAIDQSNAAIEFLKNGFQSNDEEAVFRAYKNSAGSESPWFLNIDAGQGGVVLSSTLIDSLVSRKDPRLPFIATKGSNDTYLGKPIGANPAPDVSVYSVLNNFYAAVDAPVYFFNYSEALFIKAEAIFRTSGPAAATPVYQAAMQSNFDKYKATLANNSLKQEYDSLVNIYMTNRGTLTAGNALQLIIEEKTIANFLSTENYNDWRRTGYPLLSIVQNPYIPTIPRRFPYPLAEETANPQPEQSLKITDRVWWDQP